MKEINVRDIKESVVKLIANDWALLTAKDGEGCNPMTVSWGGIGELWGKDTATVYVRESRYTKRLIDNEKYYFQLKEIDGGTEISSCYSII